MFNATPLLQDTEISYNQVSGVLCISSSSGAFVMFTAVADERARSILGEQVFEELMSSPVNALSGEHSVKSSWVPPCFAIPSWTVPAGLLYTAVTRCRPKTLSA